MDFLAGIDFTTIRLYISYVFLLLGVFDVLIGMIGLIRLPDIYNRLHATTKIATTGAFFVLLSIVIQDGFTAFGLKAVAIAIFLVMTAPVAGHVIGRAAYNINIPPCDQTLFDAYVGKRQGDYCDDYDFHEGSYVYLDIERREKDHIQSDHYEEHLAVQFTDELSVLAHDVVDHTPDTFVETEDDDDEELITGSESVEKSAPIFEQFEEHKEGHDDHDDHVGHNDHDDQSVSETEEPESEEQNAEVEQPESGENTTPAEVEENIDEKKDE